jgi:hypothetical protein
MIHNQFNIKTVFINFLDDSVKNAQLGFWQSIFRIFVESLVGFLNTIKGPTQSTVTVKVHVGLMCHSSQSDTHI